MSQRLKKILGVYHYFWALASAMFFCFPSRSVKVIGVTGTSGKSTTVELINAILEQAGFKTAVCSSIRFKIGDKEMTNEMRMTMPGRGMVQKIIRQAVAAGCQYVVLEVTSEGIVQHRHRFIDFEAGVFTNLSPEHIESHGSFESYRKAKQKFLNNKMKTKIVNLDDENVGYFLSGEVQETWGYGVNEKLRVNNAPARIAYGEAVAGGKQQSKIQNVKNIVGADDIEISDKGIGFSVKGERFNLKLLGGFNVYNALAAVCVGLSQGIDLATCRVALEKFSGVRGRMEKVIENPFAVFVDYAITPLALEEVYKTLKNNFGFNRLICVLGACGGGRDKWKRPVLGKLASQYGSEIILTNEDPYDEDPNQILSMIKSGIFGFGFPTSSIYEILDRRGAIAKALSLAKSGDVVIITGKGCESSMCLAGGRKILWDDKAVLREEFFKLYGEIPNP